MGDKEIQSFRHSHLMTFRDSVVKLPPNIKKNPKFRGKTVAEILKKKFTVTLSLRRVNKILSGISSFFNWCLRHDFIEINPASSLCFQVRSDVSEERSAYSSEDLRRLGSALDDIRKCEPNRPERFWIPIISLFTGMRLSEVCQLYVDDLIEEDGIYCFSVNDSKDKTIKTRSSKRIIPIHPHVMQLGILEAVENQKKIGGVRLWENLQKKRDGYGHDLSSWYQSFNRKFVTMDKKKVFHSFRHTFANELKQKGVEEAIIAELLGHSRGSITMERYGKRYSPKILMETIEKLEFKVFSL